MRHLYIKIYLAFLGIVAIALPITIAAVHLSDDRPDIPENARALSALLAEEVMRLETGKQNERMREFGEQFGIRFAFHSPMGKVLAATPGAPPLPIKRKRDGRFYHYDKGWAVSFQMNDGKWVTASHTRSHGEGLRRLALSITVFALVLAIGTFFVARRLTRRLESLQAAVAGWGPADTPAKVTIEGDDEVARLAESFNDAADRIEQLLGQQRRLMASASHELRTPLTRIRLAAELLAGSADNNVKEKALNDIHGDIQELDGLVADILMSARLDAHQLSGDETETIDIMELAKETAKTFSADVSGKTVQVRGARTMLKRMIANLLDNAKKHAPGSAVELVIGREGENAVIKVLDRGQGINENEREGIFEPFYRGAGADEVEGYGLGLALVSKIASRHKGTVRYRDREEGGAVFEVSIPLADGP